MTMALEGGQWSAARPGRTLSPGKTRYPYYRRLGGPQGRSGRAENLVPTRIRSRTVQPVVSPFAVYGFGISASELHLRNTLYCNFSERELRVIIEITFRESNKTTNYASNQRIQFYCAVL